MRSNIKKILSENLVIKYPKARTISMDHNSNIKDII